MQSFFLRMFSKPIFFVFVLNDLILLSWQTVAWQRHSYLIHKFSIMVMMRILEQNKLKKISWKEIPRHSRALNFYLESLSSFECALLGGGKVTSTEILHREDMAISEEN